MMIIFMVTWLYFGTLYGSSVMIINGHIVIVMSIALYYVSFSCRAYYLIAISIVLVIAFDSPHAHGV